LDRFEGKLRLYLSKLRIPYGLLTNGRDLRIYRQDQDGITLLFRCGGEAIVDRMPEIEALISREVLISSIPTPIAPKVLPIPRKAVDEPPRLAVVPDPLPAVPRSNSPVRSTVSQFLTIQEDSSMKTIAIYHNKGGVGKTTVAVNLAAAFANIGRRVLLIDMDSQANSTFATGLIKFQFEEDDNLRDNNVVHLLKSGEKGQIVDLAKKSNGFNDPEIDVIPSHITILDEQDRLNQIAVSRTRIFSKLDIVRNRYDIVILDTPPSRDLYAQVSIIAADYLIIPSDLKPFANQGLSNVKGFVQDINEYRRSMQRDELKVLGVLPSKISTNPKFREYTFPRQIEALERYGLPIFDTVIEERTGLSACANQSVIVGNLEVPEPQSIFKYGKDKESEKQFIHLAKEVLKKMGI
ncbi:MAG: ParA family protein, partial [Candidatus Nanopelagicales bacterium]